MWEKFNFDCLILFTLSTSFFCNSAFVISQLPWFLYFNNVLKLSLVQFLLPSYYSAFKREILVFCHYDINNYFSQMSKEERNCLNEIIMNVDEICTSLGPVQTSCFCRIELNSGIKFDKSTAEARRLNQTFELSSASN